MHRSHIKRASLAVLLFCFFQWAHGGTIICIGADGHGAAGHCDAKNRCKKNAQIIAPYAGLYADFDLCVGFSVWSQKYTPGIRPGLSRYKDAVAVRLETNPGLSGRLYSVWRSQTMPSSASPFLASLSTVVLLI